MSKILATLALLSGALQILLAVPAYPGKIKVTQPDGSVLTIRIHGDEWFHYITDESGRVVAQGADGFYRQAEMPTAAQQEEALQMRLQAQQIRRQAVLAAPRNQGTCRVPVVLVNFSDTKFVTEDPATAFSNLLNQEGYSANDGTGSVRDYYLENSHGIFEPIFDVYGPVDLSKTSEYYAYNKTARASEALIEACNLLDDEVDFSQYSSDNKRVDMILMYYAGKNQAEGGGETTIWPHQSSVWSQPYDGVRLGRYFCTSELGLYQYQSGNYTYRMCGIGTTCHEFGHSLGLPDMYDEDYEENGSAGGLYSYSTMCDGSYNNNGRTPPYFNSEELKILGWSVEETEITGSGDITIFPIRNGVVYKTATTVDGEYFVYECRDRSGWDRYIPSGGLLVYHVDKSNNPVGRYKAYNLWNMNAINNYGDHPCCYLIPAESQSDLNYGGNRANIPFPGNKRVKTYVPVDWQGEQGDFRFSNIAFNGSKVTMTALLTAVSGVQGTVRNTSGKPIRGATVSIYAAGASFVPAQGRMQVRRRSAGTPLMSVMTESDGSYSLESDVLTDGTFTLVATCDGYVAEETEVTIGRRTETRDFYLRKVDEPEETTFIKYDPDGNTYYCFCSDDPSVSACAGIHLSVEETAAYAGMQITQISFQPNGDESTTLEDAYVFVESGGLRVFKQKVDEVRFNAMNTVNVVSQDFLIPGNTDLYIGYALLGCSETFPLLVQPCEEENAGYAATFNQNSSNNWQRLVDGNGSFYTPVLSASVGARLAPELGFNHIANPGNGTYTAGDRFALALVRYEPDTPSTVSWTFDGQSVQGGSVTLAAGAHTVEAHLTYPDGTAEVIRLVINAN